MNIYKLKAYRFGNSGGLTEFSTWSFPAPGEAREAPDNPAKEVVFAVNTFMRQAKKGDCELSHFVLEKTEMEPQDYYSQTITYDPDWHDRGAA